MGTWTVNGVTFKVVRGNLAEQSVDVVVLGVGEDLRPEGPASGAVFGAAGNPLPEHLEGMDPLPPGGVKSVPGFELPSDRIFLCSMRSHAMLDSPETFLNGCVQKVLERAEEEDVDVLSLPPLGLGDYGFPIDVVSRTEIQTLCGTVDSTRSPGEIRLVVYDVVEFSSVDNFAVEILEGTSAEKGKGNRPNLQF